MLVVEVELVQLELLYYLQAQVLQQVVLLYLLLLVVAM
jgi:hypothetical protein